MSFKVKLKSGPQIGTSFPAKLLKEHVETASIFLSIEISSKKYTKMSSIFRSSIFMLKKVRQNNINFSLIKIVPNKVRQNMELQYEQE